VPESHNPDIRYHFSAHFCKRAGTGIDFTCSRSRAVHIDIPAEVEGTGRTVQRPRFERCLHHHRRLGQGGRENIAAEASEGKGLIIRLKSGNRAKTGKQGVEVMRLTASPQSQTTSAALLLSLRAYRQLRSMPRLLLVTTTTPFAPASSANS
jgi:hypothetical protein